MVKAWGRLPTFLITPTSGQGKFVLKQYTESSKLGNSSIIFSKREERFREFKQFFQTVKQIIKMKIQAFWL